MSTDAVWPVAEAHYRKAFHWHRGEARNHRLGVPCAWGPAVDGDRTNWAVVYRDAMTWDRRNLQQCRDDTVVDGIIRGRVTDFTPAVRAALNRQITTETEIFDRPSEYLLRALAIVNGEQS